MPCDYALRILNMARNGRKQTLSAAFHNGVLGARTNTIQCKADYQAVAPMNSSNANEPIVKFSNVALGYGDFTVLHDIDLEVRKGQVVAMMGGSGSGKTTLLRATTGQIAAQRGAIHVFGSNIAEAKGEPLRELRQRMGVLFQQG